MIANTTKGPQLNIRFEYDWQGRRIAKKVWNNTAASGSPVLDEKYVYDGWNLIAILNPDLSPRTSFMWGTDLSGSMQGAGGVGGLLAVYDRANGVHFTAFDGNGNVSGLVSAATGEPSAQYEYGPFGELLRATGPMAKNNPFRFSTKYQDDESDLLYYGYRYYNASTGRWLSRDPIEENGGLNLYGFVFNKPTTYVDDLGAGAWPRGWVVENFPPGGYVDPTPNLPPRQPTTPKMDTVDNFATAVEMFAAGAEQWVLDHFIEEGLKSCRAKAKQSGGCCLGCCVINLYLVTGKSDSYRNPFYGGSQFFAKPCFSVQADVSVNDSLPSLDPYFGRWEYERWWGYRLINPNAPDANRMRPLDNQWHARRYIDFACNTK